jgi:hypothetical protein
MQRIDESIQKLLDAGRVMGETAYMAAVEKEAFAQYAPKGLA